MRADKFIENKQSKKKRKKIFKTLLLIVFLMAILVIMCYRLPMFNIKSFNLEGNKVVSKEAILKTSSKYKGENIFYFNTDNLKEDIGKIPYVDSAEVKRNFPDKLTIKITEKNAAFYVKKDEELLIFDSDGILLEKRKELEDLLVPEVIGLEIGDIKLGGNVTGTKDNKEKVKYIKDLLKYLSSPKDPKKFDYNKVTLIEVPEPFILNFNYNDFVIKLGQNKDLLLKLNKAFAKIRQDELENRKGYIDISNLNLPGLFIED